MKCISLSMSCNLAWLSTLPLAGSSAVLYMGNAEPGNRAASRAVYHASANYADVMHVMSAQ
jgi:hypothetical protein